MSEPSAPQIGFGEFARQNTLKYEAVLQAATDFLILAHGMLEPPPKALLPSLIRSICLTITNSFQSVLLLTMNGCGSDSLKITRSMFESCIVASYLQEKPALLQDFLDFRWVKQHKHQEMLAQDAPDKLKSLGPNEVTKTVVEYGRVKGRFKGRSSWSDKNLREMAKDVGLEQQYLAIYPFGSSVQHLDVIGVMAQEDDRILDVEVLPSDKNIELALSISGMSAYIALRHFDQLVGTGKATALQKWFERYENAQDHVKVSRKA
jgi:hypothetical protein